MKYIICYDDIRKRHMTLKIMIMDDSLDDLYHVDLEVKRYFDDRHVDYACRLSTSDERNHFGYDLYILDIDMPSINGFELSEIIHMQNQDAVIMFCSNHDELVFDSYRLHTFFFIRKSHLKEDVQDAMDKFMRLWRRRNLVYIFHASGQNIEFPYNPDSPVFILGA